MINVIRNVPRMRFAYAYKRKCAMHRVMCIVTMYSRGLRSGKAKSGGTRLVVLPAGVAPGNAKLRRTKVRVVRARGGTNGMVFTNANKHSYQLQNDSRPAGAQSAYRPSKDDYRRDIRTTPFSAPRVLRLNRPELLITRIPVQSRRGSWVRPFLRPHLPRQTPQIFDTQNPMRKMTAKLRSARITGRRSCRCEIESQGDGCGKLMWKSEGDRGRI